MAQAWTKDIQSLKPGKHEIVASSGVTVDNFSRSEWSSSAMSEKARFSKAIRTNRASRVASRSAIVGLTMSLLDEMVISKRGMDNMQ